MSVVVAYKDKGRIVVGCDTRMSGSGYYLDSYKSRPKAVFTNEGYIIACVGNIGLVDLFTNEVKDLDEFTQEKLLFDVVMPLMAKLRDTCFVERDGTFDGEVIIAKNDKAFLISGNGTISELNNFIAVGSGGLSALGSLQTTFGMNITPEEKVRIAIETAGAIVESVSKEAWIASTDSGVFINQSKPQNRRK